VIHIAALTESQWIICGRISVPYAQLNPIYIYNPSAASAGSSDRVSSINIKTVRVRSISRKISFPPHARPSRISTYHGARNLRADIVARSQRRCRPTRSPKGSTGTMDRSGERYSLEYRSKALPSRISLSQSRLLAGDNVPRGG